VALVAGAYYGSAKLGLSLAFETRSVTAIWPPTGIALAALVLWGPRVWPGVALGAFLANSWTGVPLVTVLGITTGNTLEGLAGAYLLRRVGFRPSLERVRDVLALLALAGAASTAVAATVGVTSLLIGDEIGAANFGSVWRVWWLGDMGGDLLVAPVIMVAATHWPYRRAPGHSLEAVALAAAVGGVSAVVLTQRTSLAYLLFPVLIWAALRFWQPGAVAVSLAIASVAVVVTESGEGPFVRSNPDDSLLLAQTFVGVAGITALVLAAVITERRRADETVEHIARTLQESLLPARLPEIPSLEAAAHFRPAGEAYQVGGDFYDVFQAGDGSWAVVVGDVCGKGPAAAAVTGLARHTLRAGAAYESRPSSVLTLLNDAMLRHRAEDEFCTVAYARLELNGVRARLTFSTGGHPLPLLLHADGTVEPVGTSGMLLGVEADPQLRDHTIELRAGDALVLYTDGLTDAHAPERMLDADDVAEILRSCAGLRAPEIADRVESAVLDTAAGEARDDIAVVVLRVTEELGEGYAEVSIILASEPQAPAAARNTILGLKGRLDDSLLSHVQLLTTELVSNSVRHAGVAPGSPVELRVSVAPEVVRVEVADRGPGFEPEPPAAAEERAFGWGLYLVEQIADRWGVEAEEGTRVWYEIDR
jgi:serine phosphatase RsbU (regulator of sigma subunit)/anti-sigma regulatory factor (Ser/Thr protein kinase)